MVARLIYNNRPPDSSQHTARCPGLPWFMFCLCGVFTAALGFSLVVASEGCALVVVLGLLIVVASCCRAQAFRVCGLQ